MKQTIGIIGVICMLIACSSTKIMNEEIIWVNSAEVPCQGVAPMSCMQIQKGESVNPSNWELFYNKIEGFTYQAGTLYKLKVSIEKLDPATVPADASTLKYKLVEVLEENKSDVANINNTWSLTHLQGEVLNISNEKQRPTLTIADQKQINGRGGCNKYTGSIELLTAQQLVFNKGMISTKMACPSMALESNYFKALSATNSYTLKNNILHLFNSDSIEVLRFKKAE